MKKFTVTSPLVSTIIPAHNGEEYIKEAIESALQQDYLSQEIWVVDNASSDKTAEVVRSFSQVNYVFSPIANTAMARNLGTTYAQGEYLAFLDQDDWWPKQKISLQVECLQKNIDYGAVIGMQKIYLEPGCEKPRWAKEAWFEKPQYAYLPSALMVRRDVFFDCHAFNEGLPFASDVDWFLKIKNANVQLKILSDVIVNRRIHGKNNSSQIDALHKEILLSLKESIRYGRKN